MLAPDVTEKSFVVLRAPDGYKMKAIYERYIPNVQRYQFTMYIGGGNTGTTVLLSKDTIKKWNIELDEDKKA